MNIHVSVERFRGERMTASTFGSYIPGESNTPTLPPRVWRRAAIQEQIARLLDADPGRRTLALVNPDVGPGGGVSPGIDVSINVLRPGERTTPHRHTSTVISYVESGTGFSVIGGRRIEWGPGDVFTTPPWTPHLHVAAEDSEPGVRFGFSDAPLLRRQGILIHESSDAEATPEPPPAGAWDPDAGLPIEGTDVRILGYSELLKPAWRPIAAQRWPAEAIREALAPMDNGDPEYHGRRVILLFDPLTGAAQGTVGGLLFFVGIIAAGEVHPPHRHTSVAVNYWTAGHGFSIAEGERLEWEAGDLQITPAWAAHGHANHGNETVWGVVAHDTPMLYNLDVLLWQEVLDGSIARLGADEVGTPA
jgi:gentisate 1,2-dioxygenase